MREDIKIKKNKKVFVFTAVIGAVLFVFIFLIIGLANKNKKLTNNILPMAPEIIPSNKLTDENIKNMVVAPSSEKEKNFISDKTIKSLLAPIKKNNNLKTKAKESEKNQAMPVFVSDDILKGL